MRTAVAVAFTVLALVVLADALSGPCTPGEVKKEDCNECKCNKAGTQFFCTKKTCPKTVVKREACTPGASFKKECNTCVCNSAGTHASCTQKACLNNKS